MLHMDIPVWRIQCRLEQLDLDGPSQSLDGMLVGAFLSAHKLLFVRIHGDGLAVAIVSITRTTGTHWTTTRLRYLRLSQ